MPKQLTVLDRCPQWELIRWFGPSFVNPAFELFEHDGKRHVHFYMTRTKARHVWTLPFFKEEWKTLIRNCASISFIH